MKNEEDKGVTASEMSLGELKVLCKENNLDIKGLTTKADILKVVHKWEKKLSKDLDAKLAGFKGAGVLKASLELEFHEGKRVVSKSEVEHNGKQYVDIVTEGGVTHRVPKN